MNGLGTTNLKDKKIYSIIKCDSAEKIKLVKGKNEIIMKFHGIIFEMLSL